METRGSGVQSQPKLHEFVKRRRGKKKEPIASIIKVAFGWGGHENTNKSRWLKGNAEKEVCGEGFFKWGGGTQAAPDGQFQ